MKLNEQAKIASILRSLADSKETDPAKFFVELVKGAQAALDAGRIMGRENSGERDQGQRPPGEEKAKSGFDFLKSDFDFSKMSEAPHLAREQLEAVKKTAEMVESLENAGYKKPEQDNWVSRMLDNHQRGYMQSDIFTEAAVGLVWMAAKLAEKIIEGPEKAQTQDRKGELVSEIKGELAKIGKAAEKQLAHSHIREANQGRDVVMSMRVTQARNVWRSGDHQKADQMIIQTYEKLASEAKKQHMHYEPHPKFQKIISEAKAREKQRTKAAEQSNVNENAKRKEQGLNL
ncbi:hypothetical protein [Marinobacter lutaoensis]|uniref:hypothetical protein n=1 Tax=Marinobacter lutaoensis TaxID=135739 RepID=UPI001593E02D|nr:hypothetical protein [Marinobacter lutaoensis]NVD37146.1 hypothetical protein [Marinobacter lutaoensis]